MSPLSYRVSAMSQRRPRRLLKLLFLPGLLVLLLSGAGPQQFSVTPARGVGLGPCTSRSSHVVRTALSDHVGGAVECGKCMRFLPRSTFHKDRMRANGLQSWCKECHKHYRRELHRIRRIANLNRTYFNDEVFWCPCCQRNLSATLFGRSLGERNGLQHICKSMPQKI